ncbi:ATPase [Roseibium polysiphoniae]|uniref:ATPase n=1 Tax=Roseibium polysiphoniae TaxID=2571221 RepID=A0A944GS26_9HYPH|nr:AAA family ATPase [Roseibium polysiphoniae]MBS8259777.1 ATPase [Roseibium polysiphoniae]
MPSPFILSGCSGGGKSSILDELKDRGFTVVPEAGRRVVADALETNSTALPWIDPLSFCRACCDLHMQDLAKLRKQERRIFLDRSLIDLVAYLEMKQIAVPADLGAALHAVSYAKIVFLTPPWQEIFVNDQERKASFEEAALEYEHLLSSYQSLGYQVTLLPKASIAERTDMLLNELDQMDA